MDIDHFKKINDTYGHDAGDRVLATVADRVSRDLRSFDDAYRWGGEEFLLCLKEADGGRVCRCWSVCARGLPQSPSRGGWQKISQLRRRSVSWSAQPKVTTEDLIHAADRAPLPRQK